MPAVILFGADDTIDQLAANRHGDGLAFTGQTVDELFEIVKSDLVTLIKKDPENAEQAILFMMIAKYLERIGDHAVNIGEWAEYAVTGYHSQS